MIYDIVVKKSKISGFRKDYYNNLETQVEKFAGKKEQRDFSHELFAIVVRRLLDCGAKIKFIRVKIFQR